MATRKPPTTSCASGTRSRPPRKPRGRSPKGFWQAFRAASPPWWKRSQIAGRAAGAGFDWNNVEQVLEKLREELAELDGARAKPGSPEALQDEIGDLLFVIVNIARFLKVDPEQALRRTNSKFRRRFAHVEQGLEAQGKTPQRSHHRGNGSAVAGGQTARAKARMNVRALSGHAEFAEAVRLQKIIWGFEDLELLPVRFFVVASRIGGQTLGAFDGDRMAGFLLAIPGIKKDSGMPYLHSHMLGVLSDYRDAGVGRMLKLAQREDALARGIRTDRVDLRSVRSQERLFQHGAPGRDRAALRSQSCTASPRARCTAVCPRTAVSPNGGSAETARQKLTVAARVSLPPQKTRESQAGAGSRVAAAFCRWTGRHRLRALRRYGHLSVIAMAIQIDRIILREIAMPLVHFFETSFGRTTHRRIILVEVVSQGVSGWGEVTCGENPFYNEEWTDAAWLIVRDYVAPRVLQSRFRERSRSGRPQRAHSRPLMARGGVEAAVWDLEARLKGVPLWEHIGGGCVQGDPLRRFDRHSGLGARSCSKTIENEVAAGYQRIKIKIKPGWDVDVVREVRETFPVNPPDGRRQFRLHAGRRRPSEATGRVQPDDDRAAAGARRNHRSRGLAGAARHAHLPGRMHPHRASRRTGHPPARLRHPQHQARAAWADFAKPLRIHDLAQAHSIPVWCGGMLESGIGRAHNIALSTLPNFILPGDVSASKRYWARDIISPAVEVSPQGTIAVPTAPASVTNSIAIISAT